MCVTIAVLLPCYNEDAAIAQTVAAFRAALPGAAIYVYDNISSDRSIEVARAAGAFVRSERMQGKGHVVRRMFADIDADIYVLADGDATYDATAAPALVDRLLSEQLDMVVGARTGQNVHIPTARKPAKWVLNELANQLSGSKIPDLNSGLRVMRKETVKRFLYILPNSFSFTTTITLAMLSDGRNVRYIPVDYFHRSGASKINPIKDTVRFTQLVIRTVMYFDPLRVFIPLSLVLFLSSLMVLVYRLFTGGGLLVFGIVLFVSAIQVLTTGMLADLIDKSNARYSEINYSEATYGEVQG